VTRSDDARLCAAPESVDRIDIYGFDDMSTEASKRNVDFRPGQKISSRVKSHVQIFGVAANGFKVFQAKPQSCNSTNLPRRKPFSAVLGWRHRGIVFSISRKRSHRRQTMFVVVRLFSSFNTTKFFSLRLSLRWATHWPRPPISYPTPCSSVVPLFTIDRS